MQFDHALIPVECIDPGRPARLDGRHYRWYGHLARALANYRNERGFTSWVFCTDWQARQHGYRVPDHQQGIYLEHRYQEGGSTRFYNADQLEPAPGLRAPVRHHSGNARRSRTARLLASDWRPFGEI